jgi:hypothetical protein
MRSPFSAWRKACPKTRARSGTVRRRAAKDAQREPPSPSEHGEDRTSGEHEGIGAYLAEDEKRR